jgi:hypothetical protein
MADLQYTQGTVTVGTTATLIASPGSGTGGIYVMNTGSVAVVLGGSNVTATGAKAGVSLAATGTSGSAVLIPTAEPAHDLYGIVASGTSTVAFIYPA